MAQKKNLRKRIAELEEKVRRLQRESQEQYQTRESYRKLARELKGRLDRMSELHMTFVSELDRQRNDAPI